MILKGLPEFFSENRRRSAKNLPLLTWREFQRLKADCPSFFQSDSKGRTPELPLLEAPVYHRALETPSTGSLEAPRAIPDVVSEDYMEAGGLGIHEVSENIS